MAVSITEITPTTDTTPTIAGMADVVAGQTLTVTITDAAGHALSFTSTDTGAWSFTVDPGENLSALNVASTLDGGALGAETTYVVTAVVTDDTTGAIVEEATPVDLVLDLQDPAGAFVVDANIDSNDTTPTLTGNVTLAEGETLSVVINGETYNPTTTAITDPAPAEGEPTHTWTLTTNTLDPDTSHDIVATITDAAGNTSETTIADGVIVSPLPTADPVLVNDAGLAITLTGTVDLAAEGEALIVTLDDKTYTTENSDLTVTGTSWSLTIPAVAGLTAGEHDISAQVVGLTAAGLPDTDDVVASDVGTNELIIDETAPVAPTITAIETHSEVTQITGTLTALAGNDALSVEVGGTTYVVADTELAITDDTTWTLTLDAADALTATTPVTATVSDGVNPDGVATGAVTILPAPTVNVTGSNPDTTPVISGTAQLGDGETLQVTVAGQDFTPTPAADGTWSVTTTTLTPNTTYNVVATVLGANTGAVNTVSDPNITNEVTVAAANAQDIPTVTSVAASDDGLPTIQGTADLESNQNLVISVNDVNYTIAASELTYVSATNAWTLDLSGLSPALETGDYDVVAAVYASSDVIPATGAITATPIVVDVTASELTVAIPVTPAITIDAIDPIGNTAPTITGTVEGFDAGADTVVVTIEGQTPITVVAGDIVTADGVTTWTVVAAALLEGEGEYDVTAAIVNDGTDVVSTTSTDALTVDLTPPDAPVIDPIGNPVGLVDGQPTITGTADLSDGNVLEVTLNTVDYVDGDGSLSVDAVTGAWTLQVHSLVELTDGPYTISATVTDAQGNTSVPTTADFTADTTAPAAANITAASTGDTNNVNPTITGTATVEADGSLDVVVTDADGNVVASTLVLGADTGAGENDIDVGNWEVTLNTPLTAGTEEQVLTVTATTSDQAGNAAAPVISDLTLAALPTVNSLDLVSVTANQTVTISGTATVGTGETLTIILPETTPGAGNDLALTGTVTNGTWSATLPPAYVTALAGPNAITDIEVTAQITETGSDPVVVLAEDTTSTEFTIGDDAPVFNDDTTSFDVDENILEVGTVSATDVNAGSTLAYGISGGADAALFSIDAATGVLTFTAPQDYEIPADAGADHVFNLQVTVSDGTNSTVQDVAVNLQDVDGVRLYNQDTVTVADSTSEDDTLGGTLGDDILHGGEGNDGIGARGGDDQLFGEGGDDRLFAGAGNDELWGGTGEDLLGGSLGDDLLYGEDGDDVLSGGAGNDTMHGGEGNDRLWGKDGNDTMNGDDGDDTMHGGGTDAGIDTMHGGAGNDGMSGGDGDDMIYGDAGNDTIFGGNGADTITGGAGDDLLIGNAGQDVFVFGNGFGSDIIARYGEGENNARDLTEIIDFSNVTIDDGTGTDTLVAIDFTNLLIEQAGNNTVITVLGSGVDGGPDDNITLSFINASTIDADNFDFA